VGGLAVSSGGYTLDAEATTFAPGAAGALRFRVLGPDRAPVTGYVVTHDKPLHLVVVRRDLTGYQHLHPALGADGFWSVPLMLPTPGTWRAYADFVVTDATGKQLPVTLGVDLTVPGGYAPVPLPAPAAESTVDGYAVAYTGTPKVGATQPLLFRVQRDGRPVTLEPYLGANGHLVVVREGDLGYLHVHPEGAATGGDSVSFRLYAPSPGRYRAYLDFQVGGVVHTAEFTLQVT
jgi:hypothetical protein